MKMLILSVILAASPAAFAAKPECTNEGTRSEGWKMPDGKVKWDNCAGKVVFCGAIGSRSEGWYAGDVAASKQLGYANCSEDSSEKPECVNVGTRSEGWKTPNGTLLWDNCSEKTLLCTAIGTRSEGWSAITFESGSVKLLGWEKCAE